MFVDLCTVYMIRKYTNLCGCSEFGTTDQQRPAPGPSSCLRPGASVAPAPDTDELDDRLSKCKSQRYLSSSTHAKSDEIMWIDQFNRIWPHLDQVSIIFWFAEIFTHLHNFSQETVLYSPLRVAPLGSWWFAPALFGACHFPHSVPRTWHTHNTIYSTLHDPHTNCRKVKSNPKVLLNDGQLKMFLSPRASERRVLLTVGVCYIHFQTSSPLHIFTF